MAELPDISVLKEACASMHELFLELLSVGFTEDQALKYLAYMSKDSGGND